MHLVLDKEKYMTLTKRIEALEERLLITELRTDEIELRNDKRKDLVPESIPKINDKGKGILIKAETDNHELTLKNSQIETNYICNIDKTPRTIIVKCKIKIKNQIIETTALVDTVSRYRMYHLFDKFCNSTNRIL